MADKSIMSYETVALDDEQSALVILDQTRLPDEVKLLMIDPKQVEQPTLFDSYRHHALFTTTDKQTMGTVAADKTHRGHAIIEQVHADLKAGPLAHLPSGAFTANSAWLVLAVIAFNLTHSRRWTHRRPRRAARPGNDRDDSPHPHLSAGTTGTFRTEDRAAPARSVALADRIRQALHEHARTTTGNGQLTIAATAA